MIHAEMENQPLSLRKRVLVDTGQDVRFCRHCADCQKAVERWMDVQGERASEVFDLSLDAMVQMILMNDEEVLTSRLLWSDMALQAVRAACTRGIDLGVILATLRDEAQRRGLSQ